MGLQLPWAHHGAAHQNSTSPICACRLCLEAAAIPHPSWSRGSPRVQGSSLALEPWEAQGTANYCPKTMPKMHRPGHHSTGSNRRWCLMKSCNLGKWCMCREVCVVLPLAALPSGHSLPHVPTLWHGSRPAWHPMSTLTCMLAVASPSMPPKVMALVTVAR